MRYDSSREWINNDQNESIATRAFIPVTANIGRKLAILSYSKAFRFNYILVFHQNKTKTINAIA